METKSSSPGPASLPPQPPHSNDQPAAKLHQCSPVLHSSYVSAVASTSPNAWHFLLTPTEEGNAPAQTSLHTQPHSPRYIATVLRAAIIKGLGRRGTEVLFCETDLGLCQKQIDFIVLWASVRAVRKVREPQTPPSQQSFHETKLSHTALSTPGFGELIGR